MARDGSKLRWDENEEQFGRLGRDPLPYFFRLLQTVGGGATPGGPGVAIDAAGSLLDQFVVRNFFSNSA